jgi:hypothetical protein
VCVLAVLIGQTAGLVSAPLALCYGTFAAEELDECCKNLAPGQTCPMHHKAHGDFRSGAPAWTCPCGPSDAAVASVIGVAGVLPRALLTAASPVVVGAVASAVAPTLARQKPPISPPPESHR